MRKTNCQSCFKAKPEKQIETQTAIHESRNFPKPKSRNLKIFRQQNHKTPRQNTKKSAEKTRQLSRL
jgi:hypothetical protein